MSLRRLLLPSLARRLPATLLACAALGLAGFALRGHAEAPPAEPLRLSTQCPPSFERVADGGCRLRTLYDAYPRTEGHGGVQTALPALRQGFSPQQIDLGRYLFFDPLLSGDRKSSCAHCHHPDAGLADRKARGAGFGAEGFGPERHGGVTLPRRTPTLWNIGFATRLFWDGRADTLEAQAEGPLFAKSEMGNTPEQLLAQINGNASYRSLFAQAYGREASQPVSLAEITGALTAFQSTLISLNSRYDRYAHGERAALSAQEVRGLNVFRGFVARCSQCHTPPLFTNHQLAVIGSPPVKGLPMDVGAGAFDPDPRLRGAFKVPTLRNITKTGPPYFHAGQLASLKEAVEFYNAPRGHALPRGEQQSIHWHVHMLKAKLDREDVAAIVAFLGSLEDESLTPVAPAAVPSGLPVVPVRGRGAARTPAAPS